MRIFPALVLVCAGMAIGSCASHPKQPERRWSPNPDVPRQAPFHGGPNATLLKYDANHDGTLTRAELLAGLHAEFDAVDTGHSGCLDADRVRAINQQRIAADKSTATPLMDWNHDGCVDFREFASAPLSLFDQIDANGDGQVTPQEFNPGRAPGAAKSPETGGDSGARRGPPNGGGGP